MAEYLVSGMTAIGHFPTGRRVNIAAYAEIKEANYTSVSFGLPMAVPLWQCHHGTLSFDIQNCTQHFISGLNYTHLSRESIFGLHKADHLLFYFNI